MDGPSTDTELSAYIDQLGALTTRLIAEDRRLPAIVVSEIAATDSKERARIAKAHERISPEQTRRLASHIVITNSWFRGALTAMSWLMPDKMGTVRPVKSYDEALAQALDLLRELGLPPPENLEALRVELQVNGAKASA